MHKGRNAKYVVDTPKANAKYPPYRVKNDPRVVKPVVQVDADTAPGAEFYTEAKWIVPGVAKEVKLCESHTHDFNEVLGFFGLNYDNIQDLGAEIEITIDNEKISSTGVFRPAYRPAFNMALLSSGISSGLSSMFRPGRPASTSR